MTRINKPSIPTLGNAELQGDIYYVDGNMVNDGGDGKSWASAYKSLATAMAASHADIARTADRQWAGRNTIYVKGDSLDEDLTKLAQKTDIIGVGSCHQHPRCRIDGTHVLEAATTDTYHGCRFFNIEFYGAAAGIIVDIPADQNGICFINCVFSAVDAATTGIRATQAHDMNIIGCRFDPNTSGTGFSTAAIQVPAGSITNLLIQDCRISSGAIGLDFNPTTTQAVNCWVIDNIFHCVGLCIDSESDTAFVSLAVVDNRMITDVDTDTVTAGYDFVLGMANDNTITGKDETDAVPYVLQA